MPVAVKPIRLQPKQEQLYELISASGPNVPTWIGYGGARGGAKSGAARRVMLARRLENPGTPGYIIRRNFPELYENHIVKFQQEFPELSPYYNVGHKEYTLPNGSRIAFKYADNTEEIRRMSRGPEAYDIFVDQAEQFTSEELLMLHAPNRWPSAGPGVCKTALFFNPGGPGTNFLRRVFWFKDYQGDESAENFAFIHSFGWDNFEWFRGEAELSEREFYAMPGMCQCCEREQDRREDGVTRCCRFQMFITETSEGRKYWGYPPSMRLGELFGSFERFSGQYYADVWDESAVTLSPELVAKIIKPWWKRWLATDWGFSHYSATGWFASGMLSPEEVRDLFRIEARSSLRVLILYREQVCDQVAEPDLAQLILHDTPEAERQEIRFHFIGQDAWAKRGSANTVVEQMEPILMHGGLPRFARADMDRVGGWRLIYNALASARRLRTTQGVFEEKHEDIPAFFVSQACPEVMSAIPLLICKEGDPKDVQKMPGAVEDDVGDMVRYGLKSFLTAGAPPAEVVRQEFYDRFPPTAEGNTNRALAMLHFQAEQDRSRHLYRRRRL